VSMLRVYPLAGGTLATGTSGYVMAGVLPAMSARLGISPALTGQLVTIFAMTAAVAGPLVVGLTRRWSRCRVALVALCITGVGNVATALAPTIGLVVGARVVTAVGVAVYVPAATVLSAAVASAERRAQAASVVIAGLTVALLVGVPAAAALLVVFGGYRDVFLAIAGMCLIAAAAVFMTMPRVSGYRAPGQDRRVVTDRQVLALLGVTLLATTGCFTVYTYLTQLLPVPGRQGWPVAVLLACYGGGAVAGNILSGRFADRWHPAWVLLVATITSCVALVVLTVAAVAPPVLALVLMVWGGACWSVYSPANTILLGLRQPILLSLNASAIYFGMALGGLFGGLVVAGPGAEALPACGALLAAAAVRLALVVRRRTPTGSDHRGFGP
jgi:DHA1 family inner membrane transport protein